MIRIRRLTSAVELGGKPGYEIETSSDSVRQHSSAHGALFYYLKVGGRIVSRQEFSARGGDSATLYFTLSDEVFAQLKSGDPVSVGYGGDYVAGFGGLDKTLYVDRDYIRAIQRVAAPGQPPGKAGIEIELSSEEPCDAPNKERTLYLGSLRHSQIRNAGGDPHRLIFTFTPEEFAGVNSGVPVYVSCGRGVSRYFGRLDKGMLSMMRDASSNRQ
jgi:hypothetical protein